MGGLLSKGSPILEFANPPRIEPLKKDYHKILAGSVHESEIVFTNEQGIENTFALKYTPAKDENDNIIGIFISVREITEQGNIQYVSPDIIKLLKFNEKELLQSNLMNWFEPDDEKIINEILTTCVSQPATQLLTGRTRIKNKTGKLIWVEGYVTNLLDKKNINGIIYTAREVTDLVEGEASLKAEQKNKEVLINATDDLIWSINKNYELVAANEAFVNKLKQSTGIDVQPGDSLMQKDRYSNDYLTFWRSLYSRAFAGESFQEEIYVQKSATIKETSWLEVNFNPILQKDKVTGIACLSRNITERKIQEEKDKLLAVNQSLYSAIINASQDAIISKTLDGIITSWNKGAEKIFGYTEAEIVGKSITTIFPPELLDEEEYLISQIKAKQPVEHYETVRIDKNGNRKTVSLTVSPILNIYGEVIGASKISRDITRQKQDALVLQQNEARLQGIFASQTSYIIRTDLQGNYSYYNDKFFKDFGWLHKQENLIGVSGMESIMKLVRLSM